MIQSPNRLRVLALVVGMLLPLRSALGDLSLETETARLVPPGHVQLSAAFEFQSSPQGEEYDVPLALEWGAFKRFELLIEPVPFTQIRPPGGPTVQGLGDTEVTAQYLLFDERKVLPAIAGAFEVKIPTARNLQIGTRDTDFRIYAIASKRIGDFDFHVNVGYSIIGEPAGIKTKNPFDAEFAVEWFIHPKFDLFGEINYSGSSLDSSGGGGEAGAAAAAAAVAADTADAGGAVTAEVAGTEVVGTLGVRYHLRPDIDLFTSFSYDNNDAKLVRVGITWKW